MDKKSLDASKYDTDKAEHAHYLRNYEDFFRPLLDQDVRLLELGVYKGGSLQLWRDYFERGVIVGLDIEPVEVQDQSGRIRVYQGRQQDTGLLDRLAKENAPAGFDVIIDDCSHIGELTRLSFWHLFDNHLKSGGLYVIEDWSTGYWDSWFDGVSFKYQPKLTFNSTRFRMRGAIFRLQKNDSAQRVPLISGGLRFMKSLLNRKQFHSHDYGLVGFIKELVDECGMADITHAERGRPPYRPSKFKELRVFPGQVFVVKV